ncbi:uncharacterized protein EV420DRAFT_1089299 [Desarmillaria tabescens]|uniref:Uncharacterized protein n=1 Tax=Armillaria tabescens TaxID=1929756 RepID=A0AA39T4A5_ARMTA|nr:uncharacterized protein EV420DRAFT_1089299 [Desarmillaria tabescens]KAK0463451.1 hypothetical protein EV420DRAFT_1089299 [Desarmillaria tabescens]
MASARRVIGCFPFSGIGCACSSRHAIRFPLPLSPRSMIHICNGTITVSFGCLACRSPSCYSGASLSDNNSHLLSFLVSTRLSDIASEFVLETRTPHARAILAFFPSYPDVRTLFGRLMDTEAMLTKSAIKRLNNVVAVLFFPIPCKPLLVRRMIPFHRIPLVNAFM